MGGPGQKETHFSFAIRSLLMRSLASLILVTTYCVATYPAPMTPTPMAMGVLFWRSQRLADENMDELVGWSGPKLCSALLRSTLLCLLVPV